MGLRKGSCCFSDLESFTYLLSYIFRSATTLDWCLLLLPKDIYGRNFNLICLDPNQPTEANTGRPTVAVPATKAAKIRKGSKGYFLIIYKIEFD